MTCFSTMPNMYASLDIPDTGDTDCFTRKALKKIREIETLKLKHKKTPEEYTKIRDEDIWRAIAFPPDATTETDEEKAERTRKQREKTKQKEQERKLHKQYEKHKQEILLLKKNFQTRYQEQNRDLSGLKLVNAQLMFEIAQLRNEILNVRNSKSKTSDSELSTIMEKEFHEQSQVHGTYKLAWHKMMLKYHPDKFKENTELGEAFSKVLNVLRDKYVEN